VGYLQCWRKEAVGSVESRGAGEWEQEESEEGSCRAWFGVVLRWERLSRRSRSGSVCRKCPLRAKTASIVPAKSPEPLASPFTTPARCCGHGMLST
jgi:hypothetical protein